MKTILISFLALAAVLSLAQRAGAEGLALEVKPEVSAVTASVVNHSSQVQTITVMGCSWWDNWQFDDPRISKNLGAVGCFKNVPVDHLLKPGERYTHSIPLSIDTRTGGGKNVLFRVGFRSSEPADQLFCGDMINGKGDKVHIPCPPKKEIPVIWSQQIGTHDLLPGARWELWLSAVMIGVAVFICIQTVFKLIGFLMFAGMALILLHLLRHAFPLPFPVMVVLSVLDFIFSRLLAVFGWH
ncbi:MAG: hypothetical protein WCO69_01575 [Candidatus Omnitrophota bacterium]